MGTQLLNPSPAVRSAASLRHGGRFKRLLRQQGSNEQSKMLCRENQHPTGEAPEGTEPDGVHLFLAVRSGVGLLQGIKAMIPGWSASGMGTLNSSSIGIAT